MVSEDPLTAIAIVYEVEELTKGGKMFPAGIEAYAKRKESKSQIYSYESTQEMQLPENMENIFRKNVSAWKYFLSQSPSYRKITIRWVMSAKQEDTRLKRLYELIASCEAGDWIKAMRWGKKPGTNQK